MDSADSVKADKSRRWVNHPEDLKSFKVAWDVGYVTNHVEIDTNHICMSDKIESVSRQRAWPLTGTYTTDMTIQEYWNSVKLSKNLAYETAMLKMDTAADIEEFNKNEAWFGVNSPTPTETIQKRQNSTSSGPQPRYSWYESQQRQGIEGLRIHRRVMWWKFSIAWLDSFVWNAAGNLINGEPPALAMLRAVFSAAAVSNIQLSNAWIDWENRKRRLMPFEILAWRASIGTIRRIHGYLNQAMGAALPSGFNSWNDYINYLPGKLPAQQAPDRNLDALPPVTSLAASAPAQELASPAGPPQNDQSWQRRQKIRIGGLEVEGSSKSPYKIIYVQPVFEGVKIENEDNLDPDSDANDTGQGGNQVPDPDIEEGASAGTHPEGPDPFGGWDTKGPHPFDDILKRSSTISESQGEKNPLSDIGQFYIAAENEWEKLLNAPPPNCPSGVPTLAEVLQKEANVGGYGVHVI
ncbi:MAG: hypothetical protein Q9227_008886 [Pyrenula ochraceoflavens]